MIKHIASFELIIYTDFRQLCSTFPFYQCKETVMFLVLKERHKKICPAWSYFILLPANDTFLDCDTATLFISARDDEPKNRRMS